MYQACDGNILGCLTRQKRRPTQSDVREPRSRQKLKASRSSSSCVSPSSLESAFPPIIVKSRSIFSYLCRALHPPIMIPRNRQSLICVSIASFFLRFSIRAASVLLPTWKSRRTVKRVVGAYVDFSFLPLIELRTIIYPVMLDTKFLVGQIVACDCAASFVESEP